MKKTDTTRELLAGLRTDMEWMKLQFNNHLAHHFWFLMIISSAVVAEAIGFLVLVIKHVFTNPL